MKKFVIFWAMLTLALTIAGCSEEKVPEVKGAAFVIESYDDFLWKKDPVDTIKFDVNIDFKECEDVSDELVLSLCDNNGPVSPELASVFVNGEKSDDNTIVIKAVQGKTATSVGIVISRSALADDCDFYWYLKVEDAAGLKIFGTDGENVEGLDDRNAIFATDIRIQNVHVANTAKVWTNTGLIVLLIALAAAHLISRMVNRSVKFTRLIIDYGDGEIRYDGIGGAYKVVLTNRKVKVGLFHRFFVGKVYVITNEFWTSELTIKKTYGQNLMFITGGDYILPDEAVRREEFVIKNEEGRSATLHTN